MKKKDIVKSHQDFNKIIKKGSKIANSAFAIYYKDNNIGYSRYGISVGTKLGNAVFRNRYKRKIRMIVTTNMDVLKETNTDYVIILRKNGVDISHEQLEAKFVELAKKIRSKNEKKNNPVKNEVTGQNLTENILCKPSNKNVIKIYEKNGVNIKKLPTCDNFKINSGKYEGLWTSIFVKPLAFVLLKLGEAVGNYAVSLIIISLIIRLIAFPFTKKTAMQSELLKKAQPEITRIQNKYKDKQDQESLTRQSQEMMAVYKKYNISPMSGCLFSMIQLPLFIAFFEAVQRTPAIFEGKFLGLQLGTTPMVGLTTSGIITYIILMILIAATTFYSFKMNMSGNSLDPSMKMMPVMMSVMIIITALFMPSALGIYWVTTNLFTIFQNISVKRSKEKYEKA